MKSLIFLLCFPALLQAADPWLQAFPDIRCDSKHVFFSNEQWTAFYKSGFFDRLITVPRDSMELPPPYQPMDRVNLSGDDFECRRNELVRTTVTGEQTVYTLPPATNEALACLIREKSGDVNPENTLEEMGPVLTAEGKLWFGLKLSENGGKAEVGGIGWFDPVAALFGRTYTFHLGGFTPIWIGAIKDTVRIFYEKVRSGYRMTKLVAFIPRNGDLLEIDPRGVGLPGDLLSVDQWGDSLVLATSEAVALWKPGQKPKIWTSRTYAAREICWLYLKTFPGGDPYAGDSTEFLLLRSYKPTEVKAKIGTWMQVIAPLGIEGYVDPRDWDKHGDIWSQSYWNCGDSLSLARVRIPMKGKLVPSDFTNTALDFIESTSEGVKVGFRAAWAREEDLIPILLSP